MPLKNLMLILLIFLECTLGKLTWSQSASAPPKTDIPPWVKGNESSAQVGMAFRYSTNFLKVEENDTIPLPFFSYGGSSLCAFTILLFVFLRLDAGRME